MMASVRNNENKGGSLFAHAACYACAATMDASRLK